MVHPILNLEEVQFLPRPHEYAPTGAAAAVFSARRGDVARRLGARQLGYNVTAIDPGKAAFPFHSHRTNEEMFFVLSGNGQLRLGSRVYPLRAGDFVCCPAGGPETAHQIRNTGSGELRVLAVSTAVSPDICAYPDSGKFAVYGTFPVEGGGAPEHFYFAGRESQMLDYWEGEGESEGGAGGPAAA